MTNRDRKLKFTFAPLRLCVILASWLLVALIGSAVSFAAVSRDPNRPYIVLFLVDDLGWTDLSCYGSKLYETPNIDALARDGMKFTQAYSACTVCSPTRSAILTGKYPARLHVTDWIPGRMPENPRLIVPDWTKYLSLEEITIARALKEWGYATASIGKWHLGDEEYSPDKHGFDINVAGSDKGSPSRYFSPYAIPTITDGPPGEYLTDRLTNEAVRFIEANKQQAFFLYMPHFAVHTPIQAKPALIEKYKAKVKPGMAQNNAVYAAMIESLDESVGRVREELKKQGIADRTIVILASDNGGRVPTTSNIPLRVGKGSCYEGGTRVPFIVSWPGVTKPGSTCDVPVISMDLYPTIMEAAGATTFVEHGLDGVDLSPVLLQSGDLPRDELFWHYPHYQHYQQGGTTPYSAIRKADFKLIEFHDDNRVELYNLRDDIGETNNLAEKMPEKVDELRDRLHAWRTEVDAQMPTRNPNYDPAKPEHTPPPKKNKPKQQTTKS